MLTSTWHRKNEPLVVALGHKLTGGDLSCDVVLVAPAVPQHDMELQGEDGILYRVDAPAEWFEADKAEVYYRVVLEVQH